MNQSCLRVDKLSQLCSPFFVIVAISWIAGAHSLVHPSAAQPASQADLVPALTECTTRNSHCLRQAFLRGDRVLGNLLVTNGRAGLMPARSQPEMMRDDLRSRQYFAAPAQSTDPWFAMDKLQHVAFSFFITTGSQYMLVNKLEIGEHDALPISAGTSALAGISKELYDRRSPNRTMSKKDLVADGVGILLAVGLILL